MGVELKQLKVNLIQSGNLCYIDCMQDINDVKHLLDLLGVALEGTCSYPVMLLIQNSEEMKIILILKSMAK